MKIGKTICTVFVCLLGCAPVIFGQAPEGPMTPAPGSRVQQAPKIKVRSLLVSTPVTVRNVAGEMVNDLEARDFRITDNGVEQRITHFDLG